MQVADILEIHDKRAENLEGQQIKTHTYSIVDRQTELKLREIVELIPEIQEILISIISANDPDITDINIATVIFDELVKWMEE